MTVVDPGPDPDTTLGLDGFAGSRRARRQTAARSEPPPRRAPKGSFVALYRLVLRHEVSLARLALVAVLAAVAMLVAVGLRVSADESIDPIRDTVRFFDGYGLTIVVPVLSLVFASSALGDMVDDRTLVYVWLKPVPRLTIAVAAAAAAATAAFPATVVPLVLAAALANGEPAILGGVAIAVTIGVVAYTGIFTWLGLRFRRALVWGVAYILLWEGFVVRASNTAAKLSVRAYTRSILSEYTGVGLPQATLSLTVAIVVPLVVAAGALVLTGRRLARTPVD